MPITSIQLDAKTRKKLAGLKIHPRESYDDVLNKLMRLIPEGDDEGTYSAKWRGMLLESEIDILDGRLIPHEQAMKRLGL